LRIFLALNLHRTSLLVTTKELLERELKVAKATKMREFNFKFNLSQPSTLFNIFDALVIPVINGLHFCIDYTFLFQSVGL
jgi:hypothetical protein